MEISLKDFSDLAGVSKAAISKGVKSGLLEKTKSKKIDVYSDSARAYLLKKGVELPEIEVKESSPAVRKSSPSSKISSKSSQKNKSGTTGQKEKGEKFNLTIIKMEEEIGDIRAKRELREIKVQEAKDILVQRERLGRAVFGYLDALNSNILSTPEVMVDYLLDKKNSGAKKGDLIKYMREILGLEIKSTKKQIISRLK